MPTHHAGVDYLTSCHGPNRIDGVGFCYFFFGPHLHDMVSFGIYPDAARFIGIDCGFQLRGDITAWMGCLVNRPYFLDLNGSGLQ